VARQRKFKRRNVDPVVARERSVKGGRARTTPDYHIRKLAEAAATLTAEQRQQLAALAAGQDAA
jgi:hypothetical protein